MILLILTLDVGSALGWGFKVQMTCIVQHQKTDFLLNWKMNFRFFVSSCTDPF
jgi:hypothetical protein